MVSPKESNLDALWKLVRAVPSGCCTTYGRLGQALPRPVSGFLVGRWMAVSPPDVPWWRVVAKNGNFPIDKRDPDLGLRQMQMLIEEGVPMDGERVQIEDCLYEPG